MPTSIWTNGSTGKSVAIGCNGGELQLEEFTVYYTANYIKLREWWNSAHIFAELPSHNVGNATKVAIGKQFWHEYDFL